MSPELEAAVALFDEGDALEARRQVAAICRAEPDNADAWYVAAMIASPEQKAALLERALYVDPFHTAADQALRELRGIPAEADNPFDEPDVPDEIPFAFASAPPAEQSSAQINPLPIYAAIALSVAVLVGMIGFGFSRLSSAPPVVPTLASLDTPVPTPDSAQLADTTLPLVLTQQAIDATASAVVLPTFTAAPTVGPDGITATAYLHAAQTADAALRLTATAAAEALTP